MDGAAEGAPPARPAFLAAIGGGARPALKPTVVVDRAAVDVKKLLATEPTAAEDDARREYFFQAAIDKWLEKLADHTFPSSLVPIHEAEGRAIIQHWRDVGSKADASLPDYAVTIPPALAELVARVDAEIASRYPGGAFVKLTTRSPKDSKTVFRRAQAAFHARLAAGGGRLPELEGEAPCAGAAAESVRINARLVAFSEEMVKAAVVRSGKEAVTLLLDSWRVAEDLMYALEEGHDAEAVSLVLRTWDDRIRPQVEYRAFVWGERLTAIGQYWHSLFFPELQPAATLEAITAELVAFCEHIAPQLPVPTAMLDIAYLGLGRVLLVEVNPLMEGLGSFKGSTGLFDYVADADVLTGKAPFELRIRMEPEGRAQLLSHMSAEWRHIIFEA